MATKYYLKLYYEMLDDWKILSLPESLKWRFIQCLLVAGELNEDGWLPELRQFASRIRPMDPQSLQADLARLASVELVELKIDDDGDERWFIPKFEQRQQRSANAKRQARWRERQKEKRKEPKEKRKEEDKDKIVDIDIDTRNVTSNVTSNATVTDTAAAAVFRSYEDNIGGLNSIISDEINDAIDEYGTEYIQDAIQEAVLNNVRKWTYIRAILKNWKQNGKTLRFNGKDEPANKHISGVW